MNSSDAGHEQGHELVQWMSIPDAAAILGISERAVYKRCRSGTLQRRSLFGGRVEVALPVSSAGYEPVQESSSEVHELEPESSGTGHEPSSELVEQLRSENAFLRSQLQQRDVAESELRRLMMADKHELQELRQKVALLIAPPGETPVQEATPEPPGAMENVGTGETVIRASEGPEAVQSAIEPGRAHRWWEFWKGKE